MLHTKNISLDDACLKKMEPFVERHNGNFSSAIREIINNTNKSTIPEDSIAVDESLFNWLLNEVDGRLIPGNILDMIINPLLINKLDNFDKYINRRLDELDWKTNINIEYDNISSPSNIIIKITGSPQKIRFMACALSQFIIRNFPGNSSFAIKSVININDEIKIELSKSTKREGINSLITFFGGFEEIASAIKSRLSFWKCVVNRHVLSNYNMVTIHRNYYEDILAGKVPMGEIMIETLAKKSIEDIPLKEMLSLIKQVYEASRVVNRVEIHNNNIILFHNYRNMNAIEKIKNSLIMLLERNGHLYNGKITSNMIVFEHRPDIGTKINQIVENLKMSDSKFDHELIMFMTFLKGLKNMANTSESVSILGRRIGTTLMREYENENNIKKWDLKTFQRAFTTIDSKIHRESELKLENNSLLYRIKRCNIVSQGNTFDDYICRTAREVFKGALNYAFGDKVELDIKKLITHGDDYCEVTIKTFN